MDRIECVAKKSKFLKFSQYRILNINVNIDEDFNPISNEELTVDINQKHKIKNNNAFLLLKTRMFTENKAILIEIDTLGIFESGSDISKEEFDSFMQVNAPTILFPYIRSFITSVTSQMGIAPIILPTINFTKK